jgi:hypothetical protein
MIMVWKDGNNPKMSQGLQSHGEMDWMRESDGAQQEESLPFSRLALCSLCSLFSVLCCVCSAGFGLRLSSELIAARLR